MSNEPEDHTEMASDKRRRTQAQTSQSDVDPGNRNATVNSCQSTVFIPGRSSSSCDDHKRTPNAGSSNNEGKNHQNGCDVVDESSKGARSSVFRGDKAALYRNIYNSSSSEDEDEHCVYTYKGAETAPDLPNSFVHAGASNGERMSACSSPEMDFLEMDFDPGPSNGQDSDSDSGSTHQQSTFHPHYDLVSAPRNADRAVKDEFDVVQHDGYDENDNCCTTEKADTLVENAVNLTSTEEIRQHDNPCCSKILKTGDPEPNYTGYALAHLTTVASKDSDSSSDEEMSTKKNSISNFYCDDIDSREEPSGLEDSDSEDITFIPNGCNSMEAENSDENSLENSYNVSLSNTKTDLNYFMSYDYLLPLDPSYSINAVINVMKIMTDSRGDEREKLINLLRPKLVPENIPLVEYLFMRSVQNASEVDLHTFASLISEDKLHSRFFTTYPNACFNLVEWLCFWMRKGAVPVVTRNIQERGTLATKDIVRNPWRHNVVYKLESPYIHILSPNEKVLDHILHRQLSQPSLIHVKRKCILNKWHSKVDLRSLMRANHNRWYSENVLGQVVTIVRENDNDVNYTKYVRIPSNCRCGITLFAPSENLILCREIDEAEELTSTTCS